MCMKLWGAIRLCAKLQITQHSWPITATNNYRESKVSQFSIEIPVEQQVLRLDVAMAHAR